MISIDADLIHTIVVPNYRRTYIKSNSIRAKYYEKGAKKLPLEYCDIHKWNSQGIRDPDKINFDWKEFPVVRKKVKRMIDYLVDLKTGERVVANAKYVGKQNVANINGQSIYNGTIKKFERNSMIGQIKDQMRQFFMTTPKFTKYPLIIEVELWDVLIDVTYSKGQKWDVGNRFFPYQKAIEDTFKDCEVLEDDNSIYVTGPPRPLFCPVTKEEDRKLVIKIYKDMRPLILNNNDYKTLLGDGHI